MVNKVVPKRTMTLLMQEVQLYSPLTLCPLYTDYLCHWWFTKEPSNLGSWSNWGIDRFYEPLAKYVEAKLIHCLSLSYEMVWVFLKVCEAKPMQKFFLHTLTPPELASKQFLSHQELNELNIIHVSFNSHCVCAKFCCKWFTLSQFSALSLARRCATQWHILPLARGC